MTDKNPQEDVTNDQLAALVMGVRDNLLAVITEVRDDVKDLHKRVAVLEEGAFTPEEKEDLLATMHLVHERLENDALGTQDITLTRSEYDATAITTGFPNRFEIASGALAE